MREVADLAERGILPDWLIRAGMRRLVAAQMTGILSFSSKETFH